MDLDTIQDQLGSADQDKRLHALHTLKELLENDTESSKFDSLNDALKAAIRAPNPQVSFAALTCLPPYFTRLGPAEIRGTSLSKSVGSSGVQHEHAAPSAHALKQAMVALLPLDKLVDSKERVRDAAREATISAARAALRYGIPAANTPGADHGPWAYLEEHVRDSAFHSKSPKAREQALHYLHALRLPPPELNVPLPPLRPFTPLVLPLLSDPDQQVRSLALSTVIDIFSAPVVTPAGKADLKKEMIRLDVGKKVQDTILEAVFRPSAGANGTEMTNTADVTPGSSRPRAPSPPTLVANLPPSAFPADPSAVHTPAVSVSDVVPVYVATARDVHGEFEAMKSCFEGKETEHNWMSRDRSVARLRGMVKAEVRDSFSDEFLFGLKSVSEGVLKTASSLRTTIAISALSLVSELAVAFGPTLNAHHLFELFLSHCLCMAGQTKKIVATASQSTVEALIRHSHYHHRTLQLLAIGMTEKTVQARQFVSAHILTFLEVHALHSKAAIESTGGLEELEQCVRKGLADANGQVKENSRKALWQIRDIWPRLSEKIVAGVDQASRKQLEKADPRRQAVGHHDSATRRKSDTIGSPANVATKKPSVRELMIQKKREAAALAAGVEAGQETPSSLTHSARQEELGSARLPISPNASPSPAMRSSARAVSSPTPVSRPKAMASSSARRISHNPPLPMRSTEPDGQLKSSPSSHSQLPHHDPAPALDSNKHNEPASASESPLRVRSDREGHALSDNDSTSLPVPEPVVDEALREQALQAEQAAERLLELNDEASGAKPASRTSAADAMRTPLTKRVSALAGGSMASGVFKDSPDLRNGDAAGEGKGRDNWWMKRADHLNTRVRPLNGSPEDLGKLDSLISALESGQIDVDGLHSLSVVSRQHPLVDDALGSLPSPTRNAHPDEAPDQKFWTEEHRFDRVRKGLEAFLLNEEDAVRQEATLSLLKDLVENQALAFASDEAALFTILFRLREKTGRQVIGAVEGIADAYCARAEPLYSLGSLCASLTHHIDQSHGGTIDDGAARSFALGLRLMGKFFESLPSEVLEDEVPRRSELIKRGLDSHSSDLRRAAVNALVSAQSVLRDEQNLYEMVPGLKQDQINLLSYYVSRLPPV